MKPFSFARASWRFRTPRGSPGNGSPFGVKTSQMTRALPVASCSLPFGPDAGLPGNRVERVEVGHEEHVGLGDPREALDARAVEPLAVLDRLLQLVHRHLDRLHLADDVGELEADEAKVAFLRQLQGSGELGWGHREPPKSDGMGGPPR